MRGMMTSHLFAPDVVEVAGKYYLYYGIGLSQSGMAMAVADSPVGPFEYVGRVRYPESAKPAGWRDGKDGLDDGDMAFFGGRAMLSRRGITLKEYPYDPTLLLHDGRLFLYFGLMNCYVVELDMRHAHRRPELDGRLRHRDLPRRAPGAGPRSAHEEPRRTPTSSTVPRSGRSTARSC